MAGCRSFRDPVSGVLISWGWTSGGRTGDLMQDEADTFNLQPGFWKWNGAAWIANVPAASPLAAAIDAAIAGGAPTLAQIKAIFQLWRSQVS